MIEKIKELTKDTAIYGISTIVGRFFGFLLVPFYTNIFSTYEFGVFSNVYAYIAFFNIVYIYGMDAAFLKYSSVAESNEKKNVFSTPYIFVTGTTILFSLIILLSKSGLSSAIKIPSDYSYLLNYVILILLFDTLALVPFANLRLQRKAKKFAIIKTLNILINLGLNIYLILFLDFDIEAIFISNAAASLFSFLALLPEIFKYFIPKIDKELLKKMLKFGIPYLPASVAATIVQVIDRPIIVMIVGESALGIYQANYKLGIFMMLFVSMFQYAWQPFFLNNAKDANAKALFSKILTIYLFASSLILVILSLFVSDIAKFEVLPGRSIIGQEYLSGLYIVPVILLAYVFHGLYVNFQAGIYIEEKTKYFPLVTGIGAGINILANILLIPIIGIMGAAFATLASYFIMAVGLFITAQKFYRIKYEYLKIATIFVLLIASGFVYYFIIGFEDVTFINKLFILLGFTAGLFIFRVISKEEISALKKLF
ncbi:MAG: oligosaccharide flippase family protein [Melioribacteraceae bacterium]|nr:MAG: oligosaccharide flippase family protein [Melioribacteraceae bacterium]